MIAITETWIKPNLISDFSINNYFISQGQGVPEGGEEGVVLLYTQTRHYQVHSRK